MPRTEGRIFTSIWSDKDFLSLTPGAQRLYMFLLTQRELTYCGVMPLRPTRWVPKASGLTLDDILRDIKELEGSAHLTPNPSRNPSEKGSANPGCEEAETGARRRPFVITDPDTGEVFVRSLLRRDNAWKSPNLLKLAISSSEDIESPVIRAALLEEIYRLTVDESPSEQVRTLVAIWVDMLEKGSPNPSGNPSLNPSDDGSGDPSEHGSGEASDNPSDDYSEMDRPRARILQPPIPKPQSPNSLSSPSASDRRNGTRLPEPFTVDQAMKDWFAKNCPHVDGPFEHAKFCDYWRAKPGKDGRKRDWPATWRNWMRTAEQQAGPRVRSGSGGARSRRQQDTDALFERAAARMLTDETTEPSS